MRVRGLITFSNNRSGISPAALRHMEREGQRKRAGKCGRRTRQSRFTNREKFGSEGQIFRLPHAVMPLYIQGGCRLTGVGEAEV